MDNSQRDDANALRYVAVITSLLVLGLLCFSARIWTRVYPSYWLSASDYVNMSAVVSVGIRGLNERLMAVLIVLVGIIDCYILAICCKRPRGVRTSHSVSQV